MLINLSEEPEEIRTLIEEFLKELLKIRSSKKALNERDSHLRVQLINTLDNMGLDEGDSIAAPELGLTVTLRRNTISKLDVGSLLALGVSPDLIEKATKQNQSKVYVKLLEN